MVSALLVMLKVETSKADEEMPRDGRAKAILATPTAGQAAKRTEETAATMG